MIKPNITNKSKSCKDRVEQYSKEFSKLLKDLMTQAVVKVLLVGWVRGYVLS